MIALIASVFALGVGPLIYQTFGPMRRTDRIVSGFILVVITATLFIEVLPLTFNIIGYLAIALSLLGFVGPTLIEKLFAKSANKTHLLTILLGISGLVLHASIDGAALQGANSSDQHENLSLAIILHRLPVGLTIWWLLKPLIGERYALLTLVAMAAATSGGFVLSMQLNEYHSSSAFAALQAFISGSLMHVILHKPHADGCMHTSLTHEHSHHHEHKVEDNSSYNNSQFDKLKNKMPDQWEFLGMLIGFTTMMILHLSL